MAIDILLIVIMAGLWVAGGQKWSWARDMVIPIIIGSYFALVQWLLGLLLFGASNIIRMGYGAYDPINDDKPSFWASVTHDRNGWWIKAIVGTMYGVSTMSVMLFFYHDPCSIAKAVAYTAQNAGVSFLVSRLKLAVFWTDILVGISFGSIVLWF